MKLYGRSAHIYFRSGVKSTYAATQHAFSQQIRCTVCVRCFGSDALNGFPDLGGVSLLLYTVLTVQTVELSNRRIAVSWNGGVVALSNR